MPFHPAEGKLIRWYSCGPTVYDAAHIGHARNYMTFDIIRRILRDYFNYDITYVMNITDIDDKIIIRARHGHLVREFAERHATAGDAAKLREELTTAWTVFVRSKLGFDQDAAGAWMEFATTLGADFNARAGSLTEAEAKKASALESAKKCRDMLDGPLPVGETAWLVEGAMADMLAPWLDGQFGSTVTDQKIFRDLAAFWEADFLEDMAALNVLPADYMTRVSEYVPEIIAYVTRIMDNGFAYESEGSVYFDVAAFDGNATHSYAKLCPWSAGNAKFFEEGEGSLGVKLQGKRDPRDFALWKCSKPGEPFWPSPWGNGRPGWHIECSAMASSVLPATLDIHSGGIDLAFPHHDNEIAQAEAHNHSDQWVNYFLHAGHVHIEGLKMSKSLKNFISIKEALRRYSARQLRFLFLQHGWAATLVYKESSMQAAASAEATFANFFATARAVLRERRAAGDTPTVDSASGLLRNDHGAAERELLGQLDATRNAVHVALCDSFDTPTALASLLELVSRCNVYMKRQGAAVSVQMLTHALRYLDRMCAVFGLQTAEGEGEGEDATRTTGTTGSVSVALLECVSAFRDAVRSTALATVKTGDENGSGRAMLAACDDVRRALLPFGVVFEDRGGAAATLVKLVDPQEVAAMAAQEMETETRRLEALRLQREKDAQRVARAAIAPGDMFRDNAAYSKLDERGIPTHDAAGVELSKNARKKLVKEYEVQEQRHQNRV